MLEHTSLKEKVVLITGGTSGIGRATAMAMGAAGAKVVFSGRRDTEGEETAALVRDASLPTMPVNMP